MSATCSDCGRTVPPEEEREGPYIDGGGRWHCLACIVAVEAQVERWWPELQGTIPVESMSLAAILRKLGLRP